MIRLALLRWPVAHLRGHWAYQSVPRGIDRPLFTLPDLTPRFSGWNRVMATLPLRPG